MEQTKTLIDINDLKTQIRNVKSLNEWVDRNTAVSAIQNRDVVFIYYAGDETINRGYRTIEPFVLGTSTKGNLVLRAWQQAGATDSGSPASRSNDEIPGWRLFRLDKITSMSRTLRRFDEPRPKYNPNDSQMTQIIAAVNFQQPTQAKISAVSGQTPTTAGTPQQPTAPAPSGQGWFRNQYDKFRQNLFGAKKALPSQEKDVSSGWLNQRKSDFENIIRKQKTDNQDANGI